MFHNHKRNDVLDTIVACSTPIAHSGVALIRMSGEKSPRDYSSTGAEGIKT